MFDCIPFPRYIHTDQQLHDRDREYYGQIWNVKEALKYEIHEVICKLNKLVTTLKFRLQDTKELTKMTADFNQFKEALLEKDC